MFAALCEIISLVLHWFLFFGVTWVACLQRVGAVHFQVWSPVSSFFPLWLTHTHTRTHAHTHTYIHTHTHTHTHTRTHLAWVICNTPSFLSVWNGQGISRPVRARVKPGVPGARADCPPSQPLARLCTSRVLSSISIAKSWSSTSTGESTFPLFFQLKCDKKVRAWPLPPLLSCLKSPLSPLTASFCTFTLIYVNYSCLCALCSINKARREPLLLLFQSLGGCSGACQGAEAVFSIRPSGCTQLLRAWAFN